jgi:hypothetical protein
MNHTFKMIKADENAMYVPLNNRPTPEYNVTEDAIPNFTVQYFEQCNTDPPLTGMSKLYGELTYGNLRPDLILSSEKMMKRVVRLIIPNQRKPVMYGCNFGFFFNGAIWSHPENLGVEIDDGWVFLLNTTMPHNPRLNGCMKAAWMEEPITIPDCEWPVPSTL